MPNVNRDKQGNHEKREKQETPEEHQAHRIDHDHLFKELLQDFFEEFMMLFFPNVWEEIDFAQLRFLDKELFNDTGRRKSKEVDMVVETKLKGEESLILVHVEQQAQYEAEFNERMFVYFSRLLEENPGKRIIPIALFSYDDQYKHEPTTYAMNFSFLDVLTFNYLAVELKKLNWRDFIRQNNPVAGALMSKMGYTEGEKIAVKREFLRMLVRLELDPARNHMLTTFFETYLKLTDAEEHILQEEVKGLNPDEEAKVMELITSYERRGMEKGRAEGRSEGRAEGRAEGIKKVAINLLSDGMDVLKVAELTGLTEKEVKQLKQQQDKNN